MYNDTSLFGTASAWPLTISNAVHVYHMVGGFDLTPADYFHHLLFIPTLGFVGQVLMWGAAEPAGACFITGLPGGISYFLLGLQKLNLIEPMVWEQGHTHTHTVHHHTHAVCTQGHTCEPRVAQVEKRVTANLNCWVRTPGILLTTFVMYQAMLYGRHTLPAWAPALHIVLCPYNAIYYCKQAVANYTVHFITNILGQDKVVKARITALSETKVCVGLGCACACVTVCLCPCPCVLTGAQAADPAADGHGGPRASLMEGGGLRAAARLLIPYILCGFGARGAPSATQSHAIGQRACRSPGGERGRGTCGEGRPEGQAVYMDWAWHMSMSS